MESPKPLLYFLIGVFLVTSLIGVTVNKSKKSSDKNVVELPKRLTKDGRFVIEVYEVDGHDYIHFKLNGHYSNTSGDWGGHKADCKNPVHQEQNKISL